MQKPGFASIYDAYYDKIYRSAFSILLNRADAEDVVEETFLAAYAAFDRYDPRRASVATWLTRIAHNKAVDHAKAAARRKAEPLPESEAVPATDDFTERLAASDAALRLYARLAQAEREFLDLRYVMELTDAEVAALYGLNPKAVNKRYQRLLGKCRELMRNAK